VSANPFQEQSHTQLPTGRDIPLLLGGILGIGMSGPLIALSAMPIMVLIFWRNLLGALVMSPFALHARQWQTSAQRRAIAWSVLSGLLLALHFVGFFIAMRFTSVAAGTALTSLQPIFAALYVRLIGGYIPAKAWIGMGISFIGVLVITGVDFQISFRAFLGDLAAIACAALSALYVFIGAKAQREIITSTYTTICYLSCAIFALPSILILGDPLISFPGKEWLILLALVLGSQILGHTMFNFTLKRVSPAVVSLIVFFEVPVGAFFAWWWIGQLPPSAVVPGIILLLVGCGLFVTRQQAEKGLNSSGRLNS